MSALTLFIGSKNLSSWSLRPWLFLKHHGVPFKEQVISLTEPDPRTRILQHSPSGKVPLLVRGTTRVWDSLAICEYAAETFALPGAWPMHPAARAQARSITAEMHSGFADLRRELPMDCNRPRAPVNHSQQAASDIARIRAIWREARQQPRDNGEWLFGKFGIADAMFAPVAVRFHVYAVPLDGPERDYVDSLLMHPMLALWMQQAMAESRLSPETEVPGKASAPARPKTAAEPPMKLRSTLMPPD